MVHLRGAQGASTVRTRLAQRQELRKSLSWVDNPIDRSAQGHHEGSGPG